MKQFFSLVFCCCLVFTMQAQDRAASPSSKLVQKVGLTDVTVEYSRPSKKDRDIFSADGLVPYGKIWRTGANAATKITFSDDVKIEGNELAAGSYAILTMPGTDKWAVHFYPYDQTRFSTYTEMDPTVAVEVEPVDMGDLSVESFMIDVGDLRDYSATIWMVWDATAVPVSLEVK